MGGLWGISSVTTSLDNLLQLPGWQERLAEHARTHSLAVHITMTKHGEKELMLYVATDAAQAGADRFVQTATSTLKLTRLQINGLPPKTLAFQQGNLLATRKEVAVICQDISKPGAGNDVSSGISISSSIKTNENDLDYYPPFYFVRSKVYTAWIKMFVADVHRLRVLRGFEGKWSGAGRSLARYFVLTQLRIWCSLLWQSSCQVGAVRRHLSRGHGDVQQADCHVAGA